MPKLSLAIIAGNVERYINRFLDAFQPLADEIIVVRAIGTQEPDQTLAIAKARGCITHKYRNRKNHQWPHVDNFAAARNQAFFQAQHEWIMWADTDDVISEDSIRKITAALEFIEAQPDADDYDGVLIPYRVPDDGVNVLRERIVRRYGWKWHNPIHESLQYEIEREPKMLTLSDAEILHLPSGPRVANDERNLRILNSIPEGNRTIHTRFHLFQAHRSLGHIKEAVEFAHGLMQDPAVNAPEKYEVTIACAQLAQHPGTARQYLLQALAIDPARREAYGELINNSLRAGQPEAALGYAESMLAHDAPAEFPWNARRKFYGWLGVQLYGNALRANGQFAKADAVETNHFIKHGAKISLLHATRGRPQQASDCRRRWLDSAADADSIEHIFVYDADDAASQPLMLFRHVTIDAGGGCVAAWNIAARVAAGQVLVQLSDDWNPPLHWDKILLDRLGDLTQPKVLAISDGHRTDDLLCMAILTRARLQQQGYLFHPRFKSVYSDNWFTHCAYRDGVVVDARDVIFEHVHPAFGAAPMDATYAASNSEARYAEGLQVYNELLATP